MSRRPTESGRPRWCRCRSSIRGSRSPSHELIDRFDVLTFDCYGTLIDWEAGIATALRHALPSGWPATDAQLLERFAVHEAEAERGRYRTYREVLARSVR